MPGLPIAQLLSLDREPGLTRLDVLCPYCNRVHHHSWSGDDTAFSVPAPCSSSQRYRINVPGRDDNAIDVPVPNWTE